MLFAVAVVACDQGVQPDQRDAVWFTAVETDVPKPRPIEDPGPSLPAAQLTSYEPIIQGFLKNHPRLLEREDIKLQIERIENIFLASGRYHEIVALYRADVEKRGTASHVADRLAWAYIRLGQRKKAREWLDELLKARASDPMVHFLEGAFWIQAEPRGPDSLRKAVDAWKRVIELDPNFRGPENLDARVLAEEIARFEQAAGPAPPPQSAVPSARAVVQRAIGDALRAGPEAAELPTEPPPEPEQPVEPGQPAEAPPAEPAEPTPPPPSSPDHTIEQQYRLLVAKAQIALGRGEPEKAEDLYLQAKKLVPTGFDAEFGHLRAGWSVTSARNDIATKMRELAKREDLTARQRYDLGLFLWTQMSRPDLAREQFEKLKKQDPELAERVGAEGLMERMR